MAAGGGFRISFGVSNLCLIGGLIAATAGLLYFLFKQEGEHENTEEKEAVKGHVKSPGGQQNELKKMSQENDPLLSQKSVGLLLRILTNQEDDLLLEKTLVTFANSAAFTKNQDIIRNCNGLPTIMELLSHPNARVQVKAAQALSNLAMNAENQKQIQACIPGLLGSRRSDTCISDDLIQAHLQLLVNLSVLNTWHSTILDHLAVLLSLLQSTQRSVQIQTLKLLVNLSCDAKSGFTLVKSEVLPNVSHFLSTECSSELAVRTVSVVANLLENSTQNKDTNASLEHEALLAKYVGQLGIKEQLLHVKNHSNEDLRFHANRALQYI